MWGHNVEPGRPQMTIWRMRITCWKTTATNTYSEYLVFSALLLQKWLQERTPMLSYNKFAYLVISYVKIAVLKFILYVKA